MPETVATYILPSFMFIYGRMARLVPISTSWPEAELDVFLEFSYFFHDPADVGNLISDSSAFSITSLNIRKFTVHILLKPGL